jgi:predicted nucleotidyltransferase
MRDLENHYIPFINKLLLPRGGIDFVVLYGSRARGDYSAWSDTDLIVCSPAFEGVRYLDRVDLLHVEEFNGALEIICYTPVDARLTLENRNPTMLDALHEGIVLHKNGPLLDELRNEFRGLKERKIIIRETFKGKPCWRINW